VETPCLSVLHTEPSLHHRDLDTMLSGELFFVKTCLGVSSPLGSVTVLWFGLGVAPGSWVQGLPLRGLWGSDETTKPLTYSMDSPMVDRYQDGVLGRSWKMGFGTGRDK
jgi:hypothetical protein